MKKILYISMWVLLSAGVLILAGFAASEEKKVVCNEYEINILRNGENYFVEEDHIRELIQKNGDSLIGQTIGTIDVTALEMLVNTNPWVENAEVYMGINGKVKIDIIQREPLARIVNARGESFYLDKKGRLLSWSSTFSPRMIIVNGAISETYNFDYTTNFSGTGEKLKRTILDEVYAMVSFMEKDSLWKAQFEQIYVNDQKEFELIPKIGDHRILFGDTSDMSRKLSKLKIFYTEGLNNTGWNQYDTINLKYNNQVVCSKIN